MLLFILAAYQNVFHCMLQLQLGHSMSDHPMLETVVTVPPQILIKIYTFGLCD